MTYTKIPNSLIDWLNLQDFDGSEYKVIWVVIRKTIGWSKDKDKISHSQFCKLTGLAKRTVIYAIQKLVQSGALDIKKTQGKMTEYSLGKLVHSIAPVQPIVSTSAIDGKKLVQRSAPTIYNTKETKQKEFKIEIRDGKPIAIEI